MLALFLGAGFSKCEANLPVAKELFDFDIEPFGVREYRKLERVKSLKNDWDVNHPDGLAEQFIADALNYGENARKAVLWYVTRRLSEPFIWKEYHAGRWRRHVLMIDENRVFRVPGMKEAHDFLVRFCSRFYDVKLAGIVTTNYDMIVEYSLGTRGFNYGVLKQTLRGRGPYPVSQWAHPVILTGENPLAKIHGSISWDENGYYTDGRRGLTGNALIMPPTPDKQIPESLKYVWELAEGILKRANRLLVFGFAFNPYDEAVLNLLQSAGKNLESVLLIDIEPKIDQTQRLWPNMEVISCRPPPEGRAEIEKWLNK